MTSGPAHVRGSICSPTRSVCTEPEQQQWCWCRPPVHARGSTCSLIRSVCIEKNKQQQQQ
jgi:hypothetical protein